MHETWTDGARPPRAGEELDPAKLEPWLRGTLAEAGHETAGEIVVLQFPSGFSNLTYLLRVGEAEYVLRRPPFGNRVQSAHDMGREYRVLSKLSAVYPPAPRPLGYCDDDAVLGAPFYVMERRRGIILRRELPAGFSLSPVLASRLSEAFIDNLAALHLLDYEAAGLGDLGNPDGYLDRQVPGWAKRYHKAQTDSWKELDEVIAWLHESRPERSKAALIHNDYKYDNLVLDPGDLTRIVAVLDWEMCTLGDPWSDVGSALAYWTEATDHPAWKAASFGPTWVPGSLTRRRLVERYCRVTGQDVPADLVFYFVFGLFKLAVIAQQIYYRFFHGHTQDARFAEMNKMVGLLGQVAAGVIETGRV